MDQQQRHHRRMTDNIQSHWGVLNVFNWRSILVLDSAVVKTQTLCISRGGFLTYPMYYHKETIKLINIKWWNLERRAADATGG